MIKLIKQDQSFWIFWALWTLFLVWGVSLIPFHPDETSILYQSRDFEILLSNPASLIWNSELPNDYDQTYRLLNPPLPKYVLGLARTIGGYSAAQVSTDWNWSLNWDENLTAGALPANSLLYAARLINTLLFSASSIFMFFTAKRLGGTPAGLAAAILLGTNPLLLLHTRRAMSEAALIFTLTFSLWAILHPRLRPWLAGLAVSLAVISKLSAAPLFLMGLIVVVWRSEISKELLKPFTRGLLQYLVVFTLTVYLLTPLIWRQPIQAGLAMLDARIDFTQGQIDTLTEFGLADQLLSTPSERFVAVLAHQYFTPPAFSDVGNYTKNTAAQEIAYLAIPGHNLLRGLLAGGLMLTLTILGFVWTFVFTIGSLSSQPIPQPPFPLKGEGPGKGSITSRRTFLIFVAGTLIMAAALIATIPIPIQRYSLPLTPFLTIWIALGLTLPFTTPRK